MALHNDDFYEPGPYFFMDLALFHLACAGHKLNLVLFTCKAEPTVSSQCIKFFRTESVFLLSYVAGF